MTYTLKDVFYLGAVHQYTAANYNAANKSGNIPIDVSAYVDPIAKGRTRGQGLAVYKVHSFVAGDAQGGAQINTDAGQITYGLTVKPYTSSGDGFAAADTLIETGDLTPESDLLIYGAEYTAPATRVPGSGYTNKEEYLTPSKEVPYVCVRDTIFQLFLANIGLSSSDDMFVSYRMECAMITLDTATLNQLLRTQTA